VLCACSAAMLVVVPLASAGSAAASAYLARLLQSHLLTCLAVPSCSRSVERPATPRSRPPQRALALPLRPRRWSLRPPVPLSRSLEQAATRVPPHWLVPAGGRRSAPWHHGTSHAPRRTGSRLPAEGTRRPGSLARGRSLLAPPLR
jgi:hypothetical protein